MSDRLFAWIFDKILPYLIYPIVFDDSIYTDAWKGYGKFSIAPFV